VTRPASLLQATAVLGVVLAAHLSLAPRIADTDSFYHVGHAIHYLEQGLTKTAFPWATQSIMAEIGGDLWWGFHVALVPFAALGDVAWSIRMAGVVFTLVLAASVWWILRRHHVPGSGWWTLLFLLAVPNVLYRYLMVRPHVLSLATSFLVLAFLVRGRWWQVAAAAALTTWLHLGLFWMAPGLWAAFALTRVLDRFRWGRATAPGVPLLPALVAVLGGTLAGWVLRPHPVATAELAYVQIVRLLIEKASGQPLLFATELSPLPVGELLRSSWLFVPVWCGVVFIAVSRYVRGRTHKATPTSGLRRTLLLTSVLVSAVFLTISVASARRAMVEFVAFGFLALPLAWTSLGPVARRRVGLALGLLLVAHVPWAAHRHLLNTRLVAFPPDLLAEAADWLHQNSDPGDVVFHGHWDNFGPLFAWNRHNHYLGGMDPIFQLAHDPGRYWQYFYLSGDLVAEYTCDAFPCRDGVATGTHEAIRRDFGARWVLVEPRRNPKLTTWLLGDAGFELAYETQREAVFRVMELEDPSTPPEPVR
jgi:hypothetical protein